MHAWSCLLVAALAGPAPAVIPGGPDVAVVCPPALHTAIEPWVAYRQSQGHVVAFIAGDESPQEIKARLKAAFAANAQLSILLVGDAEPQAAFDPAVACRCVATHHAEAKVNIVFGSEPQIAADNWYADFDDDGAPEAPIGRLPVDSADELRKLTTRIIDYERSPNLGTWRRRINLVAGLGGFGALADAALESTAKTLLTTHLPASYETTMTYAGWQSPYCPGPARFRQTTLSRLNEGCLLWVYIGHGNRREVDRLHAPDGVYPILDVRDVGAMQAQRHPPLAVFLSCYSGAFDGAQDCLAEEMLRSDGGPIGVLCGSRVTMPYAMSILGQELMTSFFQDRAATVGQALRDAKRNTLLKPRESEQAKQFDAVAKALMPMAADLEAQRREHLHLFNLLGDPLLRLRQPEVIPLAAPATARGGETIVVSGSSPIAGRATIEFVVRRDRFTFRPPERAAYDVTQTGAEEFADTYARANDGRLAGSTLEIPQGPFRWEIAVPASVKGDCHVRVYVEATDSFALGSADVKVLAPPRTETAVRP